MHELITIDFPWILEHTDLPKDKITSIHVPKRNTLALVDEFLQVVDVSVGRCRDLEGYRFALDKTPKHIRCCIGRHDRTCTGLVRGLTHHKSLQPNLNKITYGSI